VVAASYTKARGREKNCDRTHHGMFAGVICAEVTDRTT